MVNTYTQPTVTPDRLPDGTRTLNYTPDAFGSGVGKAVQGIGHTLGDAKTVRAVSSLFDDPKERIRVEDNEAAVKRADIAFNSQLRTLLYHPETGFFARKGEAALQSHEALEEKLAELSAEYRDRLENDDQRAMFDHVNSHRLLAVRERMGAHVQTQRGVALDMLSDQRIEDALADAAADPTLMALSVATLEREIEDKGSRNGWTAEQKAQAVFGFKSQMAVTRIEQSLAAEPLEAARLYKTARAANVLAEAHAGTLERKLRHAAFAHIGETYARELSEGKQPSDLVSVYRNCGVSV